MKKTILNLVLIGGALMASCSDEFRSPDQTDGFSNDRMEEMAKNPEAAMFLNNAIESGVSNKFITFDNDGYGRHDDFGQKAVDLGLDLMSNDMAMVPRTGWFTPYYQYTGRGETYILTRNLWNYYTFIDDNLNTIIRNLGNEGSTDPNVNALKGRAHGMRAFANFMLLRLYADGEKGIPFATELVSNYKRMPKSVIEELIEKDLLLAYDLVLEARPSKEVLNKNVVAGLLSRFYLYKKDYNNVIKYSDLAVPSGKAIDFNVVNDGFSNVHNQEWLWGKDITASNANSFVSFFGHMDSYNEGGYVAYAAEYKMIDKRLYDAISENDRRKGWFSDGSEEYGIPLYANATKFVDPSPDFTGDMIYMRISEILLNKAEAMAESGDDANAIAILEDLMRTRDEAYDASSKSGQSLKEEIRLQRRIELWGEGFGFFDLKRWNVDLHRRYEGTNHGGAGILDYAAGSPKFVFQFPISEIEANEELSPADQNPY